MKNSELKKIIQEEIASVLSENIDWNDDRIYDSLLDMDHEQLVSKMLSSVEDNPSMTLLDFCKLFDNDEDDLDEAFLGFGKKDPTKEREKALAKINSKPVRAKYFKELQNTNPEKAEKMIAFFMKNSDIPYIKWDSTKKDYVDATIETDASGLTGARSY